MSADSKSVGGKLLTELNNHMGTLFQTIDRQARDIQSIREVNERLASDLLVAKRSRDFHSDRAENLSILLIAGQQRCARAIATTDEAIKEAKEYKTLADTLKTQRDEASKHAVALAERFDSEVAELRQLLAESQRDAVRTRDWANGVLKSGTIEIKVVP